MTTPKRTPEEIAYPLYDEIASHFTSHMDCGADRDEPWWDWLALKLLAALREAADGRDAEWEEKRKVCIREEREIRDDHWRKIVAAAEHRAEVADHAARQEEREVQVALWDKIESPLAMALERGGPNGTVHVGDLLAAVRALRLNARSRAEPKS